MAVDTMVVACKTPFDFEASIRAEPTYIDSAYGKHIVAGPVLEAHVFRGSARQRRMESNGEILGEHPMVVGGYGLTPNVPKDFMDKWLAQNKDYAPVKAGMVKAFSTMTSARDYARDGARVRSGFEAASSADMKKDGVEVRSGD